MNIFVLTTTAAFSLIGSCSVLILIFSGQPQRKNKTLCLIEAISISDLLIAGYSFIPNFFDLLSYLHVGQSGDYKIFNIAFPYVGETKMHSVMAIACAYDRISAMYWPVEYAIKSKKKVAFMSLSIGIVWAMFEMAFLILSMENECHDSQAQCFFNGKYYCYSIISDIAINFVALILIALVLVKNNEQKIGRQLAIMNQMNRQRSHVLLWSAVCILVSSCVAVCGKVTGLTGPESNASIFSVGLFLSGIGHSVIFIHENTGIALTKEKNALKASCKICFLKNCKVDETEQQPKITVITPYSNPRIIIRAPSEEGKYDEGYELSASSSDVSAQSQSQNHNSMRDLPMLSPLHQATFDPTLLSAMDAKKLDRKRRKRLASAPYLPQIFLN